MFMFTIFLQKPDNLNREKTVVSKVGKIEVSFPSCYSLVSLSLFVVVSVDLESCQYAAYHNFSIYPFLFNRSISVIFPMFFPSCFR